jgi:hypothetical protein
VNARFVVCGAYSNKYEADIDEFRLVKVPEVPVIIVSKDLIKKELAGLLPLGTFAVVAFANAY